MEKSNCRFAVFSFTSIALTAGAADSASTASVSRSLLGWTAPNKKRRLKPFKYGHGRQERLQSSFLLD
jgi:divalent metal cation (Fe/Co/Zn/Cd) transporter